MNELARSENTEMSVLTGLAAEARYLSETIAENMIRLGRVFTDAKRLVKHGAWGAWLRENSGCSERSAQQIMQVYARFGDKPEAERIDKSKLFKMLALPAGTEDEFIRDNDVEDMTSREVEAAVGKMRERAERAEAELAALKIGEPVIPNELTNELQRLKETIEKQKNEMERASYMSKELFEETSLLRKENLFLAKERDESAVILNEVQREYNRAQEELLNVQSAIAKGDAERTPADELTLDVFASAVRQFIGTCARMPHMRRSFGMMDPAQRNAYDELLQTVESWAGEARSVIDTIYIEEGIEV